MKQPFFLATSAFLAACFLVSPPLALAQQTGKQAGSAGAAGAQSPPKSLRPDEDWTTPFLNTTHLIPTPPIVAEKDDGATYTRELISLQWRPFDAIYLYVIKPKGVVKPRPVLFLYGYPTSTKRFLNDSYCQRITAGGCAAIGFDTALTGERFRMRPMREWFVSELPESLATSAHDVQLILNYLATRGDLDTDHSGIFGQGSGATIAVLAAAANPRIQAVDLVTPWGDWPHWAAKTTAIPDKDRALYNQPKFLRSVAPLDPIKWLPKLKDRKVRLQFLESDMQTPAESRQALEKAAPSTVTLVTYKDNMALYAGTSGGRLFEWMAQQLGATPQSAASSAPAAVTSPAPGAALP